MRPTRSYNTRHTRALAAFVALLVALPLVQAYTTGKQPHFERRQLVKRASPSSPNGISDAGKAFDGQTFDYGKPPSLATVKLCAKAADNVFSLPVVVGGGTAGLTVASRLSENSSITVAVIEAGVSGEGDTTLTTPNAMVRAPPEAPAFANVEITSLTTLSYDCIPALQLFRAHRQRLG